MQERLTKNRHILTNSRSYSGTTFGSDHKLVVTRFDLSTLYKRPRKMKRHYEALYDAKELAVNEDIRREYVERIAEAMQKLNADRTPQEMYEERTRILL